MRILFYSYAMKKKNRIAKKRDIKVRKEGRNEQTGNEYWLNEVAWNHLRRSREIENLSPHAILKVYNAQ